MKETSTGEKKKHLTFHFPLVEDTSADWIAITCNSPVGYWASWENVQLDHHYTQTMPWSHLVSLPLTTYFPGWLSHRNLQLASYTNVAPHEATLILLLPTEPQKHWAPFVHSHKSLPNVGLRIVKEKGGAAPGVLLPGSWKFAQLSVALPFACYSCLNWWSVTENV